MKITSPNSGHSFGWDEPMAEAFRKELTPILAEMPPSERIAALAYQIGASVFELDGMPDHECLDSVKAELMGQLVQQLCAAGFRAHRQLEAELTGRDGSSNGSNSISGTYKASNG